MIIYNNIATKSQRHQVTQRKLSDPSCISAFVAKKTIATKTQRLQATRRNLVTLRVLVTSWQKKNNSHQDPKTPRNTKKLSEPSCLSDFVAKNNNAPSCLRAFVAKKNV
jgi:hypothetical protein